VSINSLTDSELGGSEDTRGEAMGLRDQVVRECIATATGGQSKTFRGRPTRIDLVSNSRVRMSLAASLIPLFVCTFLTVAAPAQSEQEKLTKLAPEPVSVHVENGSGSLNLVFVLKAGSRVPAFKVTSAVGGATAIPETDIALAWSTTPTPDQSAKRTLLVANLNVNTRVFVEPNVEYKGRIIFLWPNSEQGIDFTVIDKSSLGFDLSESKLDLVLGPNQPSTVSLRVKNTGKAEIQRLTISSSPLVDSETQHRTALPTTVKEFHSAPIRPAQESEVSIALSSPELAGSYTGTLEVVANGSLRKSIPIVLRTRGPVTARGISFLPFLLFVATLTLGFWLSTKIDDWFNLGGLQRTQTLLSLQQSERGLARLLDQTGHWETDLAAKIFAQTKIRLEQSLEELRGLLGTFSEIPQEQLVTEALRYTATLCQGNLWRGFVEVALKQWAGDTQKEKLKQVLTALDAASPTADLTAYRESLRKILSESAGESGASVDVINEALPAVPPPADLKARIRFMAGLQRTVVLFVVFISAYQIFYAHHFSFGTLLDYLGVFLWTLGLTQTGSQILARARSTYNPSH
jgi:hypothetical protein